MGKKQQSELSPSPGLWGKRSLTFFSVFGTFWLFIEPLFAIIGGVGPFASLGVWRYGLLIVCSLLATIIYEYFQNINTTNQVIFLKSLLVQSILVQIIITTILMIVLLITSIKIWQGYTNRKLIIIALIVVLDLLLQAVFIYMRKKDQNKDAYQTTALTNSVYYYPLQMRKIALLTVFSVPFVSLITIAYPTYANIRLNQNFTILVANFDNGTLPDPDDYEITKIIEEELSKKLISHQNINVQVVQESVASDNQAQDLANRYKASIVIWGSYRVRDAVLIRVNFQITCYLTCQPELASDVRGETQTASRAELEEFRLQKDLSQRLTALSLFIIGLSRYEHNDYSDSIISFSESINQYSSSDNTLNSEKSLIYFYRGLAYYYTNELDKAMHDLNQAVTINPSYGTAYLWRGFLYSSKDNYKQAIIEYDLSIKFGSKTPCTYINRGVAYYNQKKYTNAIADFNHALELNSKYIPALNWRAFTHAAQNNYDYAILDYNQVISQDNTNTNVYLNRGFAYVGKGERSSAIADFVRVLRLSSDEVEREFAQAELKKLGMHEILP
jgi:tetratricopeptide (TPR) repeat protein